MTSEAAPALVPLSAADAVSREAYLERVARMVDGLVEGIRHAEILDRWSALARLEAVINDYCGRASLDDVLDILLWSPTAHDPGDTPPTRSKSTGFPFRGFASRIFARDATRQLCACADYLRLPTAYLPLLDIEDD
jgi:hypothetical protein